MKGFVIMKDGKLDKRNNNNNNKWNCKKKKERESKLIGISANKTRSERKTLRKGDNQAWTVTQFWRILVVFLTLIGSVALTGIIYLFVPTSKFHKLTQPAQPIFHCLRLASLLLLLFHFVIKEWDCAFVNFFFSS